MVDSVFSSGFGQATRLRPRGADGWGPGAAMSLGVHLMLVAALALGVRWKIDNPQVIEAEVWSEIPRAEAPSEAPPPPQEAPRPVARTETPREEEAEPERQQPIPDLVVAPKPKKEEKKPKREPKEVFEAAPPPKPKKPEKVPDKKPEKTVAKVPDKAPEKKPVTPPAKPVTSKATQAESTSQTPAQQEAQRKANMQRMMSQLGGMGSSESAGPSASYAGRIRARIKPRILFTDSVSGNPEAVVEVRCAPDGRIVSRKLIESSGVQRWDDAVLRAIDATEVLPADENGKVTPVMQISFRPNDF